jgi:hypothetical protein
MTKKLELNLNPNTPTESKRCEFLGESGICYFERRFSKLNPEYEKCENYCKMALIEKNLEKENGRNQIIRGRYREI